MVDPADPDDPAPPPIDDERRGPESLKTDERIPLRPPAALPPLLSSECPLLDDDPDDDPEDPPRTPLLK